MIKIFDKDINFIGVLEKFNSFKCNEPFSDAGSFTIKAIMSKECLELLSIGNIVVYNDFAGIIDSVQKSESVDDGSRIFASGYNLTGLLDRRIIWEDTYYNTTAENFIRTVVDNNCINPTDSDRVIPHLVLGSYLGLTETYEVQTEYINLLQGIKECAEEVGYGFNIDLDIPNKQMVFNIITQTDRRVGSENQFVLSREYDNVIEQEYTYSVKKETNTVFICSDDGTATYSSGSTGIDRKEMYLSSSKKKESLTTEQFKNVLITEGKSKLSDVIDSFDIDTAETDLSVGDVVSIIDKEWGLSHFAMVSEKEITLENGKETINYLFGNDIKEN